MIRFAHISDLHLSPIPKPTIMELLSKRLTGYINWKRNRENNYCNNIANAAILHLKQHNCQHLIISGDIVNIATNAEFLQAKQWLEKVDKTENISIVPGNHDAYIRGSLTKFSSIFSPWLKSDSDITQNTIYPYMHKRGNLAIIGLSSAIAQPPFIAAGYINQKQLKKLTEMLIVAKRENLFRVVVLHHPPILTNSKWHNSLWNYKQFQKIIYNYGAELILHGHTHLPTQHILNKTANGFTPVIGVSSLVQKNGHRKPSSSYNLFEVTTYKNKACCSFQRYQLNNDNEFKISYTKIFKWNNF